MALNFEKVKAIFAPQLSRKDGGNWSCDVLATHSLANRKMDKGATSYLLIQGKIMARFEVQLNLLSAFCVIAKRKIQ
jgi:hypothetical protein